MNDSFQAPEGSDEGAASVQGYYVGYKVADKGESFSYKTLDVSEIPQDQQLETNIRELKKSTKYVVVVQAFNSKGAGPVSDEVISQTLEIGNERNGKQTSDLIESIQSASQNEFEPKTALQPLKRVAFSFVACLIDFFGCLFVHLFICSSVRLLETDPPPAANLKLVSSTSSSVHLAWNIAREQPINGRCSRS